MVRELKGVLVAALIGLVLAAPASATAAPTGSISGAVTDADSHAGIKGVEVCASRYIDEDGEFEFSCTSTGPTGAYVVAELEAGGYEVEFRPKALPYFGERKEGVEVGVGPVSGIDAELTPAALIEGTVSAGGEAVEEGRVCAWRLPEHRKGLCDWTDDAGLYRIRFATGGSFGVEFQAVDGYATRYFDHRRHWREGDPITATVGAVTPGIDAMLEVGGELRGSVFTTTGLPLPEILVCAIEAVAAEPEACDQTGIFGQYSLGPLATGTYKVGFSVEYGREFFGEELFLGEKDGFETRFYDERASLAAADPVGLVAPGVVSGIDARLISTNPPAAVGVPAAPASPSISTAAHKKKALRCRSGFRKKKVKGKLRCVRVRKHRG